MLRWRMDKKHIHSERKKVDKKGTAGGIFWAYDRCVIKNENN